MEHTFRRFIVILHNMIIFLTKIQAKKVIILKTNSIRKIKL